MKRRQGSGEPLYLQLARALRAEILAGAFRIGSALPTEDELRARFGVSRQTVREALRRLREDHLVASRQGAGTIVVSGDAHDAYAQDILSVNDLVDWAVGKRFEIESMEMQPLPEALLALSGARHDEPWLCVRGFGYDNGVPTRACLAQYYIHPDFASVARLLQRHRGPIFPLIEDLFGVKVAEVHQTIGATLLAAELANSLAVQAGSAALELQRCYRLSNRQVAQVTISTHPSGRYRHSTTLRRVKR